MRICHAEHMTFSQMHFSCARAVTMSCRPGSRGLCPFPGWCRHGRRCRVHRSNPLRDEVDPVLDVLIVVVGELPHSVLGVGIDEHGKEHLAFERLDVSDVLGHGAGEVVHSRVVGGETGSSSSSDPSFFHGRPASQHTTTCADVCLLRCEAGLFVSFDTAFGSGAAEVPCEPNTEHSIRRSVPSPTAVFCIRSQAT